MLLALGFVGCAVQMIKQRKKQKEKKIIRATRNWQKEDHVKLLIGNEKIMFCSVGRLYFFPSLHYACKPMQNEKKDSFLANA